MLEPSGTVNLKTSVSLSSLPDSVRRVILPISEVEAFPEIVTGGDITCAPVVESFGSISFIDVEPELLVVGIIVAAAIMFAFLIVCAATTCTLSAWFGSVVIGSSAPV